MLETSVGSPHLRNEIDPLRQLMLWGEPGCEALLGQLLPKTKSLFLSYYDVPEARREFRRMQALIEAQGVQVLRAKDAFVSRLRGQDFARLPASLKELQTQLVLRADSYFEAYRQAKVGELMQYGAGMLVEDIYYQVRSDIPRLLEEDVDAYGEQAAIKLNHVLSLSRSLPISNIFYGRDQSSALGDRILLSRLHWEIRKPEVEIYRQALLEMGYGEALVEIGDGTIEGGDIMIFGDTCYVGVGARTTLSAVTDLCIRLGARLQDRGIRLAAVVNERHVHEAQYMNAPTEEHMRIMHLDMFWIPLGPDLVLTYGPELDARQVVGFTFQGGDVVVEPLGGFREFLRRKGCRILEVTTQEQHDYATNLLNLGNQRVIVSLSKNERVIAELQERGYRVLQADLNKLVGGYGAIHCLTAPLQRQ
jgi:arginine deiminase